MKFLNLLGKEFLQLKKSWGVIVILFFVPLFLIGTIGFAFQDKEKTYQLGFVDYDNQANFSTVILKQLKNVSALEITEYSTDQEASKDLNDEKIMGYIVIPKGLDAKSDEGGMEVSLVLDNAHVLSASILENITTRYFEEFNTRITGVLASVYSVKQYNPDIDPELIVETAKEYVDLSKTKPITVNKQYIVTNAQGGNMSSFNQTTTGMTAMFILFLCILWGSGNILEEKLTGTLTRLVLSPINSASVISAKMLFIGLLSFIQFIIFFTVGHFVLNVPVGNLPMLILVSFVFILQAASIGLLVSLIVKSRLSAMGISFFIIMFLSPLGGLWFPLDNVPEAMHTVAKFIPTGAYMIGMEKVMLKGGTLIDIWSNIAVMLAYFFVAFIISIKVGIKKR